MTNYAPIMNRRSLLEGCLFNAFKEEWIQQKEECILNMNSQSGIIQNKPYAYESFNLKNGEQNFSSLDNPIFTESLLLFKKMYDEDSNTMIASDKDTFIQAIPTSRRFDTTHFDMMTIEDKMSFKDAVKFAHSFYLSSPGLMYGILLHNNKKFINPLHPLIAQSVAKTLNKDASVLDSSTYKVIIYTYKETTTDENNAFFRNENLSKIFTDQIFNTLALLELKVELQKKIVNYNNPREQETHVLYGYKDFIYKTEDINKDTAPAENLELQPVQLINSGIVFPYYGTVAQKHANMRNNKGYQLSPMLSPNIGMPRFSILKEDESLSIEGRGVCTGKLQQYSLNGKKSLNHANLGSPFFREVMASGAYTFADISVKISLSIYAELFDLERIDSFTQLEKPPISFVEFRLKHPSKGLKDYLLSIKK
jgi:hypothetical protein